MSRPIILFFDHTATWSGGEVALYNLLAHLDRSRFTPVVLLASEGPLAERLRALSIETVVWPLSRSVVETRKDSLGPRSLLKPGQAAQCVRFALRLARFLRRRQVAVVHCNSLKSDLIGGVAARLAGVPCVWHVRDHVNGEYLPSRVANLFRALARRVPTAVVANSGSTLASLGLRETDAPSHCCRVVHDGIVPEAYAALIARPPAPPTLEAEASSLTLYSGGTQGAHLPANVVLVGRIAPWKGQDVFLRAAARLAPSCPQARFQIVGAALFGETEYEQSLHCLAAELGITDRVEFLGFREDIPALQAAATVIVHASTFAEPFGQVVIEGMAAGKPVVATDGGALRDIVVAGAADGPASAGETGLLVPMGDAEAMAQAIGALLADPERAHAMGEAGRRRVQELFTITRTARQIETVFESLLRRPPTVPALSGLHSEESPTR